MTLLVSPKRLTGLVCLAFCACSQYPAGSTLMEKIKESKSPDSTSGLVNLVPSPDGQKLLTTTRDGHFVVWNSRTLKEMSRWHGAPTPPLGLAWTNDNEWVAVTRGGSISWEARLGKELTRNAIDTPLEVGAIEPNGGLAFGAGKPGPMRFFQSQSGQSKALPQDLVPELTKEATAAAFSPNRNRLALALNSGNDDKVLIVDTDTGKKQAAIDHSQGRLTQLVYSQNGLVLATAGQDHEVGLWDAESGSSRGLVKTALPVVGPIAFSEDANRVAVSSSTHDRDGRAAKRDEKLCPWGVSSGNMIQVFDTQSTKEIARTSLQGALCSALLFTQNANGLFSAGENGILSFWKLPASEFSTLPGNTMTISNEA